MNILVIEDSEYKFKQIEESLKNILKNPDITWMDSRNAGLVSFQVRNVKTKNDPYHIVITDNYLPLYSIDDNDMFERDEDVQPFAADIVNEIRRLGFEELPIIVCSSEDIEECDYNYKIKYDSSVSLDESFKTIFSDFYSYMAVNNLSLESIVVSKNNSKLVIHDTGYLKEEAKIVEIKKSEDHDRLVEATTKEEQGPVKRLLPEKK